MEYNNSPCLPLWSVETWPQTSQLVNIKKPTYLLLVYGDKPVSVVSPHSVTAVWWRTPICHGYSMTCPPSDWKFQNKTVKRRKCHYFFKQFSVIVSTHFPTNNIESCSNINSFQMKRMSLPQMPVIVSCDCVHLIWYRVPKLFPLKGQNLRLMMSHGPNANTCCTVLHF